MPEAARTTDVTQHGPPLSPGPGSLTVEIGMMPAWRALPESVGAAVEAVSDGMDKFMTTSVLTPADSIPKLALIQSDLAQAAAMAAAEGNPAGVGAVSASLVALNTTDVALTATWTTASAAPGGQPAANNAYTEGIKAAAAAAASAVMSAVGGMADMHMCPIPVPVPPHGPGMVTQGSKSVLIDNLPACRKDDKVMEACGGADPIAMGCPTVLIGDDGGGPGGGGGGGSGKSGGAAGVAGGVTALREPGGSEGGAITPSSIEAMVVSCECSNPDCAKAFEDAAEDGTPLVDRETHGCGGTEVREVATGTHWIDIGLVGEDGRGIPDESFVLKLPNGEELRDRLDKNGRFRVEGIEEPGPCQVSFPNLDRDAWEEGPTAESPGS